MYRCTGTLVVVHPTDTINDLWYSIPSDDYGIQRQTFPKTLSAILLNSIQESTVAFQIYFPTT